MADQSPPVISAEELAAIQAKVLKEKNAKALLKTLKGKANKSAKDVDDALEAIFSILGVD